MQQRTPNKSYTKRAKKKPTIDRYFDTIEMLKKGPMKPSEIIKAAGFPTTSGGHSSSFYEVIGYLELKGIVKKLDNGRYVAGDFEKLEGEIIDAINKIYDNKPSRLYNPEELKMKVGRLIDADMVHEDYYGEGNGGFNAAFVKAVRRLDMRPEVVSSKEEATVKKEEEPGIPELSTEKKFAGLDVEYAKKYNETMRTSYFNSTLMGTLSTRRVFTKLQDGGKTFVQVGLKTTLPQEWFDKKDNYSSEHIFREYGEAVSRGEVSYMVKTILEQFPTGKIITFEEKNFNYELLEEHVKRMKDLGFKPDVLFVPMHLWREIFGWVMKNGNPRVKWVSRWNRPKNELLDELIVDGSELKIVHSTKSMELNEVIILDSSKSGTWVIKPDKEDGAAITSYIYRSQLIPTKVECMIRTLVNYTLNNPEAVTILSKKHSTS